MSMLVLIILLLVGGVACWQAERFGTGVPRLASFATVCLALLWVLVSLSGLPG